RMWLPGSGRRSRPTRTGFSSGTPARIFGMEGSDMDGTTQGNDGALAQILLAIGEMKTQQAVMLEILKAIPDHESRIRKLEAWRYGLPIAGLVSAGSAGLAIYSTVHR